MNRLKQLIGEGRATFDAKESFGEVKFGKNVKVTAELVVQED